MARDRQKDARDQTAGRFEGRPKALRRELADLETELERARDRRDRAQARVEALEAIAEQLAVALASAEAAREARRSQHDEPASVLTEPASVPTEPVPDEPPASAGRSRKRAASATSPSGDRSPSDGVVEPAADSDASMPKAKSKRKVGSGT